MLKSCVKWIEEEEEEEEELGKCPCRDLRIRYRMASEV